MPVSSVTAGSGRVRRSSSVASTLARSKIGTGAVMAFTLGAAAPLTVIAGAGSTGFALTGYLGVPVAYLAIGGILAVFTVGYVAMSRHIGVAGGFYVYITAGLGRPAGVAAAMVAQLGYNLLQISLYGAFGVVAAIIGQTMFGWEVAWWIYALAGWLAVAVMGVLSVKVNGRILAALLAAEIAIVVLIDTVLITHPAGGQVDFAALNPALLADAGAAAILVGGLAGFVGFESSTVFAAEVKDPKRTIARATYLALAVIAALYGLSTWAMTVATGPHRIVAQAQRHGTDLYFDLAAPHLPAVVVQVGGVLLLSSLAAALLAFHAMIARQLFALGRERVLPAALGRTGRRTGAPVNGSVLQSVIALGVLAVFVARDLDPITHLFFFTGITGGLGVLILMTATSVAVIMFFARFRSTESAWHRRTAPALAALLLAAILAVTIAGFGDLLDVPGDSLLRWLLPAVYLAAISIGAITALLLRTRRPDVYTAIGHGPATPTSPIPAHRPPTDHPTSTSAKQATRS